MLNLDVSLGQVQVHLGDFESRVPQNELQGHHISTVHQIPHCEGVAEEVAVEPGNTRPLPKSLDALCRTVVAHGRTIDREDQFVNVRESWFCTPSGQIAKQGFLGGATERHEPLFPSLSHHFDVAVINVGVLGGQSPEFASAYSGVEQQQYHHVEPCSEEAIGVDSSENPVDLLIRENLDHRFGQLGPFQTAQYVLIGEALLLQPGRKGLQGSDIGVNGVG